MDNLGALFVNIFRLALTPLHALTESVGLTLTDMQLWSLIVALFMIAAGLPGLLGDITLLGRRVRTSGRVVEIETDSDGARTPRIEYRDHNGATHIFSSTLPTNRQVGDSAEVLYHPDKPALAREAGRPIVKTLGFVVWWGFALVLLVLAFGPWMKTG